MSAQTENFITNARREAQKFYDSYHSLKKMQTQWNALAYGDALPAGAGENTGITKTEVGAVVFDTVDAVTTLLGQGHATNLAKLLY